MNNVTGVNQTESTTRYNRNNPRRPRRQSAFYGTNVSAPDSFISSKRAERNPILSLFGILLSPEKETAKSILPPATAYVQTGKPKPVYVPPTLLPATNTTIQSFCNHSIDYYDHTIKDSDRIMKEASELRDTMTEAFEDEEIIEQARANTRRGGYVYPMPEEFTFDMPTEDGKGTQTMTTNSAGDVQKIVVKNNDNAYTKVYEYALGDLNLYSEGVEIDKQYSNIEKTITYAMKTDKNVMYEYTEFDPRCRDAKTSLPPVLHAIHLHKNGLSITDNTVPSGRKIIFTKQGDNFGVKYYGTKEQKVDMKPDDPRLDIIKGQLSKFRKYR